MYNFFRKRLNSNSRTGFFSIFGNRYFYKILTKEDYGKEIIGYDAIKDYYPVPNLLKKFKLLDYGVLIFTYEFSVDASGGQVVDFFSNVTDDRSGMKRIFQLYRSVFSQTVIKAMGYSADVFYRDRVHTRLDKWYTSDLLASFMHNSVTLNGKEIKFEPLVYVEDARQYFGRKHMYPCVISQCDPQDLNLGTKPVVFDYHAGGLTPLMAEYASYLWFNIGMGNYLAPLLNPHTYCPSSKIFLALDTVTVQAAGKHVFVNHCLSEKRQWALREYTQTVIDPLIEEYPSWKDDLLQHLTMRVLTVFNLTEDRNRDQLLFAFAYLGFFRGLNAEKPSEFVDRLLSIYE